MRYILALVGAVWLAAAQPAPDSSREIFKEIDRILGELSEISGMRVRGKVASDLITREKVKEFLNERVKEVAAPEEIRAEELALKKFGLVPADFDLAATTVDVLTEQAAAFYDFKKKRLFITDWTPSRTREAALVHELAHALADQNFNLDRFIRQARKSDDAAVARMAVMEGQATWLMSEYLARQMGQSLKSSPALVRMMSQATEHADGQFPVFEKAPLYIRESLVFPYTRGMIFQHAVFERSAQAAFTDVFRHPPVSTQQILHPERYFDRTEPAIPDLPPLPALRGYKDLIEGTFGELDHAILLQVHAGKERASDLSPHLRGGRYKLLENRGAKRVLLAYASAWDSLDTARQFFQTYREALAKKWKRMEVTAKSPVAVAGMGDDGYFRVELRGAIVTSVEGAEHAIPEPAVN